MTQEAEIRRIVVQSQLRQIVCEALSWEKPFRNKQVGGGDAGGVAQGEGPEFKPNNTKKKEKLFLCI
jgi:hypothetical protein